MEDVLLYLGITIIILWRFDIYRGRADYGYRRHIHDHPLVVLPYIIAAAFIILWIFI